MTASTHRIGALNGKAVLLVEDDEALMNAIAKMLEKHGARVITAENGNRAMPILRHEHVDLVLSDIQMPEMNGVELTRHIKKSYSLPVILMTAFSDLLESKEAAELGADAFFPKPFDSEELRQTIQLLLGAGTTEPMALVDSPDATFYSLPIEEFTSGRNIPYPIFLRVFEQKFIQVAYQGEDLELQRIQYYKTKGIRFLYLSAKDFCSYTGFNLRSTKLATTDPTDQATRAMLADRVIQILDEEIPRDGLSESTYSVTSLFIRHVVNLLCQDQQIFALLRDLQMKADYLFTHSVAVSTFSVLLARQLGWTLPTNLFKVAMAGMLHDLGELETPPETVAKSRAMWSEREHEVYESHSMSGFEKVRLIPSVPSDVLQVMREHHENCIATGFPDQLKRSSIHPLAKLIAVADEFCTRVVRSPRQPHMSPEAAIRELLLFPLDYMDIQFFRALLGLYKYDAPEPFRKRMVYGG